MYIRKVHLKTMVTFPYALCYWLLQLLHLLKHLRCKWCRMEKRETNTVSVVLRLMWLCWEREPLLLTWVRWSWKDLSTDRKLTCDIVDNCFAHLSSKTDKHPLVPWVQTSVLYHFISIVWVLHVWPNKTSQSLGNVEGYFFHYFLPFVIWIILNWKIIKNVQHP